MSLKTPIKGVVTVMIVRLVGISQKAKKKCVKAFKTKRKQMAYKGKLMRKKKRILIKKKNALRRTGEELCLRALSELCGKKDSD